MLNISMLFKTWELSFSLERDKWTKFRSYCSALNFFNKIHKTKLYEDKFIWLTNIEALVQELINIAWSL